MAGPKSVQISVDGVRFASAVVQPLEYQVKQMERVLDAVRALAAILKDGEKAVFRLEEGTGAYRNVILYRRGEEAEHLFFTIGFRDFSSLCDYLECIGVNLTGFLFSTVLQGNEYVYAPK